MSTRSLKASFIFNMTGNIRRQAQKFGDGFERMGRTGDRELGRIGRAADAANRKLNAGLVRGAQAAGVAIGVAAVAGARHVFSLEERLERLGINAGKTTEEMMAVRDSVNDVANMPNIRIDPAEIISGMEAITTATGDFDFADSVKEEMAMAIQATGAGGAEIGKLMAALNQKFDVDTPDKMMVALDTLAQQGKQGAIELLDLATLGPKVFSAFGRFGQGGVAGMSEAGGLMQIFKESVGSPQEAATVFENVMNNLYNPKKMKDLRTAGVEMEDADGNLKGPADLIKAVIESAKGKDLDLSKVFDAEAMRGFSVLSKSYREGEGFAALNRLTGIRGDGSAIGEDSARMAAVSNSQFQSLKNNAADRFEDNLMEPLTELTKSLNALLDKGLKFTMEDALNVAAGGAAAVGLAKAGLWTMGMGGRRRGKGGGGGVGGLAGGALGVQPVFVTNMPGGGMMGDVGGGNNRGNRNGGGRPGGRPSGGRGGFLRNAGRAGGGLALGAGGAVAATAAGAGLAIYGAHQVQEFRNQTAAIEASAPWVREAVKKRQDLATNFGRNTSNPHFGGVMTGAAEPARGRLSDDMAMAQRKRVMDRLMNQSAVIRPAPALTSNAETTAELSAKLEAFLDAQEDTREETQVSGDKVVRAVKGLGEKLGTAGPVLKPSGMLMSQ